VDAKSGALITHPDESSSHPRRQPWQISTPLRSTPLLATGLLPILSEALELTFRGFSREILLGITSTRFLK